MDEIMKLADGMVKIINDSISATAKQLEETTDDNIEKPIEVAVNQLSTFFGHSY